MPTTEYHYHRRVPDRPTGRRRPQVYLVVNLLLAALYDAWKEAHEKQLQKRRVRQYHALIAAYLEVWDQVVMWRVRIVPLHNEA